jgi:ATP-dependent Clp protease ATP-binding subunit ClpA
MIPTLQRETRLVLEDARAIARELGSSTLEAEHLLLALARTSGTVAKPLLDEAGLDEAALRDALAAEFGRSLAAVGVSAADFDVPVGGGGARVPRWGASARSALARMSAIARRRGDRRISTGHLLLGILAARVGTVPRALAEAGIERPELAARVEGSLPRKTRSA